MNTLRRPYLLIPGEPLLLARPHDMGDYELPAIFQLTERAERMASDFALKHDEVGYHAVSSIPLPRYGALSTPVNRCAPADMLWNPLLWLPERLALPCTIDNNGALETESVLHWRIRVALELTMSGIYRSDEATWVDVLALYGLDIAEEYTIARVKAWQAGGSDAILDTIDLDDYMRDPDDPMWAVAAAHDIFEMVYGACQYVVAGDFKNLISQVGINSMGDFAALTAASARNLDGSVTSDGVLVSTVLTQLHDKATMEAGQGQTVPSERLADEVYAVLSDVQDNYEVFASRLTEFFAPDPEPAH